MTKYKGRKGTTPWELDAKLQRAMYALRNKWEHYVTPGGKLDPRFTAAKIYTKKNTVLAAERYWRYFLKDDTIHIKNLVLTVREFD